jgi:hypothetical protein
VISHLRDGLAGSEEAIIKQLVADGGQHSPRDLADESGYHLDTIYRALRNNELVAHSYDDVSLRTPYFTHLLTSEIPSPTTLVLPTVVLAAPTAARPGVRRNEWAL